MRKRIRALLVHEQDRPWRELNPLLEEQGMRIFRASTCAQAKLALSHPEPPLLVFTDIVLSDGTWSEVVALSGQLRPRVPVIIVSRLVDIDLYLTVLESGAADFIVPPFQAAELAHVMRSAGVGETAAGSARLRATGHMSTEVNQDAENYAVSAVGA
jgi:two-component system OmpR family response regulator